MLPQDVREWVTRMNDDLKSKSPDNASDPPPTIFRVPVSIREVSEDSYNPKLFSFGLYNEVGRDSSLDTIRLDFIRVFKNITKKDWSVIHSNLAVKGNSVKDWMKLYDGLKLDLQAVEAETEKLLAWDAIFVVCFLLADHYRNCRTCQEKFPFLRPLEAEIGKKTVAPLVHLIRLDIFKLENQIPLSLIKNVFNMISSMSSEGTSMSSEGRVSTKPNSFNIFVTDALCSIYCDLPRPADIKEFRRTLGTMNFENCTHLLECLYLVVCYDPTSLQNQRGPQLATEPGRSSTAGPDAKKRDGDQESVEPGQPLTGCQIELVTPRSGYGGHGVPTAAQVRPPSVSTSKKGNALWFKVWKARTGGAQHEAGDVPVPVTERGQGETSFRLRSVGVDVENPGNDHGTQTETRIENNPPQSSNGGGGEGTSGAQNEAKDVPATAHDKGKSFLPPGTVGVDVENAGDDDRNIVAPVQTKTSNGGGGEATSGAQHAAKDAPARTAHDKGKSPCNVSVDVENAGDDDRNIVAPLQTENEIVNNPPQSSNGGGGAGTGGAQHEAIDFAMCCPGIANPVASMLPFVTQRGSQTHHHSQHVPTVTKLKAANITVAVGEGNATKWIWDVNFRTSMLKGILYLPVFAVYGETQTLLRNLLVYEYTVQRRRDLLSYIHLLNNLINTEEDVELMKESGVLKNNSLGSDKELAEMWNTMLKSVVIKLSRKYQVEVFDKISEHCKKKPNKLFGEAKQLYLSKPWHVLGVLAAFLTVAATVIAMVYTVLTYYYGNKQRPTSNGIPN